MNTTINNLNHYSLIMIIYQNRPSICITPGGPSRIPWSCHAPSITRRDGGTVGNPGCSGIDQQQSYGSCEMVGVINGRYILMVIYKG